MLFFSQQFKESQNGRMVEAGRDLWRSSRPTPLLKQGHLELVAQECVFRWLLSVSEDGYSTTSMGNLCQCSVTLTVRKCFSIFRWNVLCFS